MVGQLELGRTIALPVLAITMLNLRVVQVTDAKHLYAFNDYFGTRIITAVISMIVIGAIGLLGYGGETCWVIFLWGIAKSIDSVSDIVRGYFQKHERMDICGISLILRSIFALLAVVVAIRLFDNLLACVIAIGIIWFLTLVLYDFSQAYRMLLKDSNSVKGWHLVMPRFKFTTFFELLKLAFPLGVILFLINLQNSVPRGVLEAYYGESALGYFGPIVYPTTLGIMLTTALGQSASPRLAKYYVDNIVHFRRLMEKLLLFAIAMGLLFIGGVFLFGKLILSILYTAEYAVYHPEFIIVSIGVSVFFLGSFCGYGLTAARKFKMAMFLKIIPCLTSFVIAFWLIPSKGIRGAALTCMIVFIVTTISSFTALFWLVKLKEREAVREK